MKTVNAGDNGKRTAVAPSRHDLSGVIHSNHFSNSSGRDMVKQITPITVTRLTALEGLLLMNGAFFVLSI